MKKFLIIVEAEGGVGCGGSDVDSLDGHWCGLTGCPKCLTRTFVAALKHNGAEVKRVSVRFDAEDVIPLSSADVEPKPPSGLLPTKEEFAAAGYDPAIYDSFIANRKAEISSTYFVGLSGMSPEEQAKEFEKLREKYAALAVDPPKGSDSPPKPPPPPKGKSK